MLFLRSAALLLAMCISLTSFSQGREFLKPDYDAIKKATHDKGSAYYYPSLFERYKSNDTTLTPDQYKYVYYGYFFNKADDTASLEKLSEETNEIRTILSAENPGEADLKRALQLSLKHVEHAPFDLRKLNYIYRINMNLGDTVNGRKYFERVRGLIRTILNSGDGRTDETGYHILDVSHEYFVLSVLGYESTGQKRTPLPCDYLTLKSNEDNLEGIYFDVTQIFAGYNEMFKDVGKDFLETGSQKKNRKKR